LKSNNVEFLRYCGGHFENGAGEERSLSILVGTISNVLVMEIGWTDVGSGWYILVLTVIPGLTTHSKNGDWTSLSLDLREYDTVGIAN
jgi:hypothetical protein